MADICVVYARRDAARIPEGIEQLFPEFEVWWDRKVGPGDYRATLEAEIDAAGCLVPIWSAAARSSATLHDELERARKRGIPLVPLRIHDIEAPLGFGVEQATNLIGWDGSNGHADLGLFVERIRSTLAGRRRLERPGRLLGRDSLKLPQFFFSVSSYETKLDPPAAVQALDVFQANTILVSAYDMLPAANLRGAQLKEASEACEGVAVRLQRCRDRGGLVLLDSGKYEKTRTGDKGWQYPRFKKAVEMTPHDYLLSFDELNPRGDIDKVVQSTVERARRDATVTGSPIVPIIHVPQRKDGEYRTEWLPDIAHGVASALQPEMIAIPERELGAGVFSRVRTLVAVRQKLSELYRYVPIHILGTGYPTSIALLAAAGADSFDGLEWCRFVMDADLGTLHHFHHYDFYEYQAAVAASPITAASVADDKLNYAAKAVFHNLDAYGTWLSELRSALSNDRQLIAFLTKLLPDGSIKQVLGSLPGVT